MPRFGFVPGQWLSFKRDMPNGQEITRAYSIASPPSDDNRFALRLAEAHATFYYLPTLSRGGPEWRGLRGYVQEHVGGIVQGRTGMRAYVCGLAHMVAANREQLEQLGFDRKSILYEKYD